MTVRLFGMMVIGLVASAFAPAVAAPVADALLPSAIPTRAMLKAARKEAAADPQPLPAISPVVRIGLSPDLGAATPAVQAMVRRYPFFRIAEPAEYVIGTLPDYPNTVLMRPSLPPMSGTTESSIRAEAMTAMALRPAKLGNLVLDDYAAPFAVAAGRIGRVRALMALGTSAVAAPTTCLATSYDTGPGPRQPGWLKCQLGGGLRADETTPQIARSTAVPSLSIAVRNEASAPRYLYAVMIDPAYQVTVMRLNGGRLVKPHAWAEQRNGPDLLDDSMFVTIASAQALPDALLGDRAFAAPQDMCAGSQDMCAGSLAARLCGATAAPPATDADWSSTIAFVPTPFIRPSAIGGGSPVPSFSLAPFMVEMYSTVPFTADEIEADKIKPVADRLFLADRSEAERDHRCGGSLIAPDLILTAAHCVAKDDLAGPRSILVLSRRRIRLGTLMLGSGGQTFAIDAMVVHAGYRSGQQLDDIALLRLKADRATAGASPEMAVPIALAGARDPLPAATPVDALGWGYTEEIAPGARTQVSLSGVVQHNPSLLRDGQMETLDWTACRKRLGDTLRGNMLCGVTRSGIRTPIPGLGVFSCVGDSGGPLVRQVDGRFVLVGITSWSRGCSADDQNASVYTNVARYADWIAAARIGLVPGQVVLIGAGGKVVPPATAQ